MRKVFFSNLVLMIVLNALIKPFFILGIDAGVQNAVGSAIYGDYFALLNFSFLFNILLDFGITNYNTRNIAQSPNILKNYLGPIIGLRTVLFFVYIFFTIGFGLLVGYSENQMKLLRILVLNQFFVALLLYFRSNFAGLHLFKTDALFSVLDRFLLIIICGGLLWGHWLPGKFKIEWFVWAQTFTYGFTALCAFIITIKKSGFPKVRLKKQFSFVVLKQAFPYALLVLIMMLYNRIDAVMLERMLDNGKVEAGIYAQGFRLLDAVNMFALMFAGLLLPIFSRLLKKRESLSGLLTSASLTLMSIATITAVCCSFFAYEIIDWRYHEHILVASNTFAILILSFIPISLTYIYGTLLTANGSLKVLNTMALIGLGVNVLLNYWLIPQMGALGSAIATLVTQIATALIQTYWAFKIIAIQPNYKALIKFGLFATLTLVSCYVVKYYFEHFVGLVIASITSLIWAFIIGTLPTKEALQLLKSKR